MARIRIICDGGGSYGFGNLRRSATLTEYLRGAGHQVFVQALSDEAQRLMPISRGDDVPGDVWLLDLPYAADGWVANARVRKKPVAALDYIGSACPDLMISIFDHGHAPASAKHLVGLDYAIIRRDVYELAPASTGESVVVIMGGGDQNGLGAQAARRVADAGQAVTLVEGPLAAMTDELPPMIKRRRDPSDIAELMAGSEWGVTSGGGTMMEMMCLAKAVHAVPRTPLEVSFALNVLSQGAILGVGLDGLKVPSEEARQKTSQRARQLVDGRGTSRIAAEIQKLI